MSEASLNGKTLLLVGSVPGGRNVGQLLLREMLACVDPDRFVVAALLNPNTAATQPTDHACITKVFARPREHSVRRFEGRLGGLHAAIERVRVYDPAIARVTGEVAAFAEQHRVQRIWAVLNTTAVIDICTKLLNRLPLPLLAHVWDDIEHLSQQRRLDAFTRRRTAKRFAQLLKSAERTAVIGESMADNYSKYHYARCQIVRHGVSDTTIPREQSISADEFVIGFSGGMYCHSAWQAIFAALAHLKWRVAGKSVRFVVLTGRVTFPVRTPVRVDYLGWRSDAEAQSWLSECDLLYLPQPFEPAQRSLAELSFPTKLSSYVGTGRPVMVHGPEYASLVDFARKHPVGVVCTSLDPVVIADAIASFAGDAAAYRGAARVVADVANSILSRGSFKTQVKSFLRDEGSEVAAT